MMADGFSTYLFACQHNNNNNNKERWGTGVCVVATGRLVICLCKHFYDHLYVQVAQVCRMCAIDDIGTK